MSRVASARQTGNASQAMQACRSYACGPPRRLERLPRSRPDSFREVDAFAWPDAERLNDALFNSEFVFLGVRRSLWTASSFARGSRRIVSGTKRLELSHGEKKLLFSNVKQIMRRFRKLVCDDIKGTCRNLVSTSPGSNWRNPNESVHSDSDTQFLSNLRRGFF